MPIEAARPALELIANAGVIAVALLRLAIWLARSRRNRLRRIVREELQAMQREACDARLRLRYLDR
jgi:hypothetical protein